MAEDKKEEQTEKPKAKKPRPANWGGAQANAGRKPGRVSQLTSTHRRLKEMSPKALDNIQTSVNGKEVDKEVLSSSKWVISTLHAINKTVEDFKEGNKPAVEDADIEVPKEGEVIPETRFRLTMAK